VKEKHLINTAIESGGLKQPTEEEMAGDVAVSDWLSSLQWLAEMQ